MAKKQPPFTCLACGGTFPRWLGKCPECGEWNSLVKTEPPKAGGTGTIYIDDVGYGRPKP